MEIKRRPLLLSSKSEPLKSVAQRPSDTGQIEDDLFIHLTSQRKGEDGLQYSTYKVVPVGNSEAQKATNSADRTKLIIQLKDSHDARQDSFEKAKELFQTQGKLIPPMPVRVGGVTIL